MLKYLSAFVLSASLALGLTPAAQASATVNPNGVLTASTAGQSFENLLNLQPGMDNGFTFSGHTGSFSQIASTDGYYYAAYLFTFTAASSVESAVLTLNKASGVSGLSERLYAYTGSFLGDASAGSNIVQPWVAATPALGFSVASLTASDLPVGSYVLEIRGINPGNFAGTISFATPVPEPLTLSMLMAGLGLLGLRRRILA